MSEEFKAIIKNIHISRDGWDTYRDESFTDIYANSAKDLDMKVVEHIKGTETRHYGDFGTLLSGVSCEVVGRYKVVREVVTEELK